MFNKSALIALAALLVITSFSCTKIEKQQSSLSFSAVSPAVAPYKNPYGLLINKSSGTNLERADQVNLAHDLGVQYVRLSIESGNWYNDIKRKDFLAIYSGYTAAIPSIEILLNINWRNEAEGPVAYPGASTEYKDFVKDVIDTFTSGSYVAPAVIVVENEENNPNFHVINTLRDISNYTAQLRYVAQVCKQKGIKVANGGFTTLGMNLLVWDYYKNVENDSIRAERFLRKMLPPEVTLDMTSKKVQTKIQIVKSLINNYALLEIDYFNFHWYEPVQALFWTDTILPKNIDTNHISPDVLEAVLQYVRLKSPVAGRTVITNETGQITSSPEIPKELTCAMQGLPVVCWYSGDGNFDDAKRKYQAYALHNVEKTTPYFTLRPNGLAFKENIKAIIANPNAYCLPFAR
jgi:hypothetical protein